MRPAVVRAVGLMPTSAANPDPTQVATGRLPIGTDGPRRLTATCSCAPGTPEAEQFKSLVIEVPGYTGPLDQLDATVAADVPLKVWLADNGRLQAQGLTSEWSFMADPAGTP